MTTTKSIRITKAMAENAADAMATKVYSEKIIEARNALVAEAISLVKKYIPSPVLACVSEYEMYFDLTSYLHFHDSNTSRYSGVDIAVKDFQVPSGANYITLSTEDFKLIGKTAQKVNNLQNERYNFEKDVCNTLVALRTTKNISEKLPEAMEYLDIPEVNALPVPLYNDIRLKLQSVK